MVTEWFQADVRLLLGPLPVDEKIKSVWAWQSTKSVYSEQVEGSTLLDKLELDADKKYAIVMGNEVKGVQQEVVNACDGCIEIPQYGTKHSLNVSVTTGIIVWEFANKLMKFR